MLLPSRTWWILVLGLATSAPEAQAAETAPTPIDLSVVHGHDVSAPLLIERSDGLEIEAGRNVFAAVVSGWSWNDRWHVPLRLRLESRPGGSRLVIREAMVRLRLGDWVLSAGRGTRRLGRGERGRLLLDDNARALDMVELRTRESVRLPGPLTRWGTFDVDVLNAVLPFADTLPEDPRYRSDGDPVTRPNLLAMRFGWAPRTWLEVGATRTMLYSGRGRERYDTFGEWWALLTASDENDVDARDSGRGGDQLASVDLAVDLPWLHGRTGVNARYYIEYAGTDVHASWQGDDTHSTSPLVLTDVGVLQGVRLTTRSTALVVEFARIHADWYRHAAYPQGYTNGGVSLGHPMGGDARSWFVAVEHGFGGGWRAALSTARDELRRTREPSTVRWLVDLRAEAPLPVGPESATVTAMAVLTDVDRGGLDTAPIFVLSLGFRVGL